MATGVLAPACGRDKEIIERFRMNPYFEQTVLNADPVALTAMVYQRAISSIREARERLRGKRIRERSDAIMRAYWAIVELLTALHPEAAPEISTRLQQLYSYMLDRLVEANIKQADAPLEEVLKLMTTLSEAWSVIASGAAPTEPARMVSEPPMAAPPVNRWSQASAYSNHSHLALSA